MNTLRTPELFSENGVANSGNGINVAIYIGKDGMILSYHLVATDDLSSDCENLYRIPQYAIRNTIKIF